MFANEHHNLLLAYFNKHVQLPELLTQKLVSVFEAYAVTKNRYVTKANDVETHLYFVVDGIQLVGIPYVRDEEKQEQVIAFTYKNHFTGSFPSLFTQSPSDYFIKTISDSVFLRISRKHLFELLDEHMEMNIWIRNAAVQLLMGSVNREKELLHFTPAQRYQLFLARSAYLVQHVPQKYIASYLGITPETYSRLRKKT